MNTMTDDVVVVGGRGAGAPTDMLLACAGLSVRLLERSARLGNVVSGHLISRPELPGCAGGNCFKRYAPFSGAVDLRHSRGSSL